MTVVQTALTVKHDPEGSSANVVFCQPEAPYQELRLSRTGGEVTVEMTVGTVRGENLRLDPFRARAVAELLGELADQAEKVE